MKKSFVVVLLILLTASIGNARKIGGIDIPETLMAGKNKLVLNGAGIRTMTFFNIYVAGLYLEKRSSDYKEIINADKPMAIKIIITSNLITSKKFIKATEAGFRRSTNGNTEKLKSEINLVYSVFKDKMKKGDVFDIIYLPEKGTEFYKNTKLLATQPGIDLKRALFGIWIIDNPAHKCKGLRRGMLGIK